MNELSKEPKTATEVAIEFRENEYYSRIKHELAVVLDFVERWNKNDKEHEVAQAAAYLERLIRKPSA